MKGHKGYLLISQLSATGGFWASVELLCGILLSEWTYNFRKVCDINSGWKYMVYVRILFGSIY